jgi:hypothetical protein
MARRPSNARALAAKTVPAPGPDSGAGMRALAWRVALLALLVLTSCLFLYASGDIRNPDPFYYAQAARQVLEGQRLYTEVWPDKPPVLIWAYALPQLVAPRSYRAVAVFGGCCVAMTALIYAWAFRHHPMAAATSALFLAILPLSHWDWAWPSSEMVANVFVGALLLLALTINRDGQFTTGQCVTIGVCTCLAFHVRQNMVLSAIVPLFAIWQTPLIVAAKVRAVLVILASVLVTWGLILALVFATGDVPMYFWTVFEYPRLYANLDGAFQGQAGMSWILTNSPLVWIVVTFGALAVFDRPRRAFVLVTLVVGCVAALAPGRYFAHYWANTFPFAALVVGLGTEWLARTSAWKSRALAAGLVLVLLRGMFEYFASEDFENRTLAAYENVAAAADQIGPQDGTLMVMGTMPCEAIQFASRLRPANTYQWMFQLLAPNHRILPTPLEEIRRQYLTAPPDVLVIGGGQQALLAAKIAPGEMREDVLLGQALLREHHYRPAAKLGDFEISLLDKK